MVLRQRSSRNSETTLSKEQFRDWELEKGKALGRWHCLYEHLFFHLESRVRTTSGSWRLQGGVQTSASKMDTAICGLETHYYRHQVGEGCPFSFFCLQWSGTMFSGWRVPRSSSTVFPNHSDNSVPTQRVHGLSCCWQTGGGGDIVQ